ncbi:MAG TPA: C39 family peptidase [Micromonosporaceae bacterium]|nr:C39 family peptidase [Micromonosporaceae bacterium]
MTAFSRWLPATLQTSFARKAALGVAGLAFAGGAIAGPAMTATNAGSPAVTPPPAAVTVQSAPSAPAAPSAMDVGVDYERQPNYYYCGPASARIALSANGHVLSQDDLAKKLGTTENGTDSSHDITRVLNKVIGRDDYRTVEIPGETASGEQIERLRTDVIDSIRDGDPVVANIIGTATDTDGNQHSLPGGHYLTVVGYKDDGRTVKIADPFETRGDGTYWMSIDTLAHWIASRGYSA